MHVDHVYVGTVAGQLPVSEPEHHVRWFTPAAIAAAPAVSEDSRLLAARLLALAAGQPGPHFSWSPRQRPNTKDEPRPGPPAEPAVLSRTRSNPREKPQLIIIRGNSASGKSTIAATIRARHEARDLAIVSQDTLRRDVLREHDAPGGVNIELLDQTARFAMARGFHVILEGILYTRHYADMLTGLITDHPGQVHAYYLDIPFGETLRRHATKAQASEYGESEMRAWYRRLDLLPGGIEQVIPAESSLDDTVRKVMTDACLGSSRGTLEASSDLG